MSGPSAGYQFVGGQLATNEQLIGGGTQTSHQMPGGVVPNAGGDKFSVSGSLPGQLATNVVVSHRFLAAGGIAPYTYSVTNGALPAGLSLNTTQGIVSGFPTTVGNSTFTIHAVDAAGNTGDSLPCSVAVSVGGNVAPPSPAPAPGPPPSPAPAPAPAYPAYLGPVANTTRLPTTTVNNVNQVNSRSSHFKHGAGAGIRIAWPNIYVRGSDNSEQGVGSTTLTASIEYPVGVFTQVKWAGATSLVASPGISALSDAASVAIPDGAHFWIRTFANAPGGLPFLSDIGNAVDAANGELAEFNVNTDKTMGGTIDASNNDNMYGPCAVLGQTTLPTVFVAGDSRCYGAADVFPNASGNPYLGEIMRSIGPVYGTINVSRSGDSARDFRTSVANNNRSALKQYCTHAVYQFGVNDIYAFGRSAAQLEADLQFLAASAPALPTFAITIPPETNSTDNWATTANQTPTNAGSNTIRVTHNNTMRGGLSGITGVFEIADQVESARDSGLWKANYTPDGVHENTTAALAIKNSNAVNTALIHA